jgi:alkylation response protein AidB-like acyl-CoA dehydrogenase
MATTTAVKDGNDWVINGSKMFATNGTTATYMNVFCLTDPENTSRHRRHGSFSCPPPPRLPGHQDPRQARIRAPDTAELMFKDLRLPAENLVGSKARAFPS